MGNARPAAGNCGSAGATAGPFSDRIAPGDYPRDPPQKSSAAQIKLPDLARGFALCDLAEQACSDGQSTDRIVLIIIVMQLQMHEPLHGTHCLQWPLGPACHETLVIAQHECNTHTMAVLTIGGYREWLAGK